MKINDSHDAGFRSHYSDAIDGLLAEYEKRKVDSKTGITSRRVRRAFDRIFNWCGGAEQDTLNHAFAKAMEFADKVEDDRLLFQMGSTAELGDDEAMSAMSFWVYRELDIAPNNSEWDALCMRGFLQKVNPRMFNQIWPELERHIHATMPHERDR